MLHWHSANSTLSLSKADLANLELIAPLASLVGASSSSATVNGSSSSEKPNGTTTTAATHHDPEEQVSIPVEVWIASDKVHLYSPSTSTAAAITYPSISLHARQGQGLYMQLVGADNGSSGGDDAELLESAEVVLTPPPSNTTDTTEDGEPSPIEALYTAVSACADLHPDPAAAEDAGGEQGLDIEGLLAGDGANSGWITAENVHEFVPEGEVVDERAGVEEGDGPVAGQRREEAAAAAAAGLGAGAGTTRRRGDGEDDDGAEGEDGGGGEETKWRRTG